MHSWPPKDPNENLDYEVDWTARLEQGESMVSANFILVDGTVVIGAQTLVGAVATVWLSGGADGETAHITCRGTTSVGRVYDETVRLRIRSS